MNRFLLRSAIIAICLLSVGLDAYGGQKASGRVESIVPTAAPPGEQVTVTGRGFGARNTRVAVGSAPAAVVKANGHTIVFTVPAGATPGITQVTITNPGGQGGTIPFTVLSTLPQNGGLDLARAEAAVITPHGGSITAASANGTVFTLDVPPGAVPADTTITLTPVTSLLNFPLTGTQHFAARLAPAGLVFDRPASLTIAVPRGVDASRLFGFSFNDDGSGFEILPTAGDGTAFSVPIAHFTTAGLAEGTLADFEAMVQPLLSALPNTLPPTQVTPLLAQLGEWLRRFGPEVCSQTSLCTQVFAIAHNSLSFHRDQASTLALTQAQQGEPFLARATLKHVISLTATLLRVAETATAAGLPGFDAAVNLDGMSSALAAMLDTTGQQALENPRAGILLLLLDITADAAIVGLEDVEASGRATLAAVLNTLLQRGQARCETDADAGELLLDLVRNTFPGLTLDQIAPDLATRYYEAWAGCRIRITPATTTITRGKTQQFTATASGLATGFTWSVEEPSGNGTIDPSGLYTAGRFDGSFTVIATSTAAPARFKRASVRIVQIGVVVSPTAPTVQAGDTLQFAAAVTNATNTAIRWTASGGTVDQNGLFTAGSEAGTYFVRATSLEDEAEFGESYVTITRAATTLVGRITAVMQLNARTSPGSTQDVDFSADLVVRDDGTVSATGVYLSRNTFPFECGIREVVHGGIVKEAKLQVSGAVAKVQLAMDGFSTEFFCGELWSDAATTFTLNYEGAVRYENGRIVEIDFGYEETYSFPGHVGFYRQGGILRRE